MTTLAVGQLVIQNQTSRVWRLERQGTPTPEGQRWVVTLAQFDGTISRSESRRIGDVTTASEAWLQRECRDWTPPTIDPPCGDGVQVMRIVDGNNVCLTERRFDNATEMVAWTEAAFVELAHDDHDLFDLTGQWFGWAATDGDDMPDMTVTPNEGWAVGDDDLHLVWAET